MYAVLLGIAACMRPDSTVLFWVIVVLAGMKCVSDLPKP